MEVVIALDAGTTSVRAVALDRSGREVATASRPLASTFPEPGLVEQDAAEIAELAVAVLRAVATTIHHHGHHAVALGLTNQRETTLAFDRDSGHLPHRALVWQDRRTAPRCDELRSLGVEPRLRRATGLVLDPYFSATKMEWLADHGHLDGLVAPSLATLDTWLVWWLTGGADGGEFLTEPSNASRTLLLDLTTLRWSPPLLATFGVDRDLLPDLRPSTGPFGHVDGRVVPELAHLPIAAVLGDQQSALFGQAGFTRGVVKATYGTGSFVLAHAGDAPPEPVDGLLGTVAWDLGPVGPVSYALEGSAFVAGAAVQWLRDELGLIARASDLEPLARTVADAGGVQVVPAFTGLGSPFWRPDARGAITGLSSASGPGHLARALVTSLAHQVRAMTDAMSGAGLAPVEIRADGGAAAMDLLLELQATDSRVEVVRSTHLEATARGAATLAGLATGLWGSLDELTDLWSTDRRVRPADPAALDADYAAWRRAVERA